MAKLGLGWSQRSAAKVPGPPFGSMPAPIERRVFAHRHGLACAGLIALALGGMPGAAQAQEQPSERNTTFRAYARVEKSCAAETRRFCPAASVTAPQPRAMVICLRPYKASLSLGCRGAINAVSRPAAAP